MKRARGNWTQFFLVSKCQIFWWEYINFYWTPPICITLTFIRGWFRKVSSVQFEMEVFNWIVFLHGLCRARAVCCGLRLWRQVCLSGPCKLWAQPQGWTSACAHMAEETHPIHPPHSKPHRLLETSTSSEIPTYLLPVMELEYFLCVCFLFSTRLHLFVEKYS